MSRIGAIVDADGSDADPLCDHGPDERRELTVLDGIDGLGEVRATLDPIDREALETLLDAHEQPDPPDTPPERRRSAGQRRADAFAAMLCALFTVDATPTIDGYAAQILGVIDLLSLLGLDRLSDASQVSGEQVAAIAGLACVDDATARRIAAAAIGRTTTTGGDPDAGDAVRDLPGLGQPARTPRLRYTGETIPQVIRRLADHAKFQAVLTLGPWRAVSVGRTMRTLPPWLRTALTGLHGHCRGPDCDRPVPWTQAHHIDEWAADHGDTDLNRMVPLCPGTHHSNIPSAPGP